MSHPRHSWVIYPDPNREMLSISVKQLFHPFFGILRNPLITDMVNPVLGSIFGERKVLQTISSDVFMQVQ
jgi:hypothetical protein